MSCDVEQAAGAYGSYFETLRPDNVDRLHDLAAPDIRFVDPFNDMRGVNQVVRLLHRMFEDATEVSFRMLDQACQGDRCFLHWEFFCRPRRLAKGRVWRIEGVSMVRFDVEHIDYWDAAKQFYGRLPVIGALLRGIGRWLQLPPSAAVPKGEYAPMIKWLLALLSAALVAGCAPSGAFPGAAPLEAVDALDLERGTKSPSIQTRSRKGSWR